MLSTDQLNKIEQDAKQATPGPWETNTKLIAHYRGGSYPTHTIRTSWIQGQLKDKMPVVATATGLGESPGEPAHTVWMSLDDAAHIANCDPQTVMELVKMARRNLTSNAEAEFEIRQEGMMVAATFGPRETALAEARHYAAVYGQDGPTEIVQIIKIEGDRG